MTRFVVVDALPVYGPAALSSPPGSERLGRQGIVVRFEREGQSAWTGNFAPGPGSYSAVLPHPDGHRVLVIAGGAVYEVDPDAAAAYPESLCCATNCHSIPGSSDIVLELNHIAFVRWARTGRTWETKRLSWDGFRDVVLTSERLTGDAWCPPIDAWQPFEVDIATGDAVGGAFD